MKKTFPQLKKNDGYVLSDVILIFKNYLIGSLFSVMTSSYK